MAQTAIAGLATLSVNGRNYLIEGAFKYSPSSRTRESLVGMDGIHGFKETPIAPSMSGTLRDAGGLSVADLNTMTDVTVTAQLANGKTIVGRNMWTTGVQEVDSVDGKVDVRWEGLEVIEL